MEFPDQYHVAAVWQRHVLDERKQRRLAELVARRQRRRARRPLRELLVALFRLPRRRAVVGKPVAQAQPADRTSPVGCAV